MVFTRNQIDNNAIEGNNFQEEAISELAKFWMTNDLPRIDGLSFQEFLNAIAFLGFKPEVLSSIMQQKAHAAGRNFETDIITLVGTLAARGSNLTKMIMKMSSTGKALVQLMKQTYGLSVRAKTSSDNVVITLPRIAATYPWCGIKIFKEFPNIQTPISPLSMGIANYPKMLMAPDISSLIPSAPAADSLFKAIALYQIMFTKLVSPERLSVNTAKTQVELILTNARNSTFISENCRLTWLKFAELVEPKVGGPFIINEESHDFIPDINVAAMQYMSYEDWTI